MSATCLARSLRLLISGSLFLLAGAAAAQQSRPDAHGQHGVGHDNLHHWYTTLYDRSGKSCCNLTDCRPTVSREREGRVEVMVDGEWTIVPADKILDKSSPDLGSHVCSPPRPNTYPKGHIFCVVLGSGV
jgi:hypothetical protein